MVGLYGQSDFCVWPSTHAKSWILCSAVEDIENAENIRSLLEDVQNIRQDKIRNGLCRISADVQSGGTAYAVQVSH
jgi:hypothetical protein